MDAFRSEEPGDIHNDNSLVAFKQQKGSEEFAALVVQKTMKPMSFHQRWNKYGDLAIWVHCLELKNVVDNGCDDITIWRFEHYGIRCGQSCGMSGSPDIFTPFG